MVCHHLLERNNKLIITWSGPIPQEIFKGVLADREDSKWIYVHKSYVWWHRCVSYASPLLPPLQNSMHGINGRHQFKTKCDQHWCISQQADFSPTLGHPCSHRLWHGSLYLWCWQNNVVNVLLACKKLDKLGDPVAIVEEVIEEAIKFVGACYGSKTQKSISKVRYHIWAQRTCSKKITKTPRLKSLPPTSESLAENIKRAHIQTYIWKAAMKQYPPRLYPTDFGWSKDEVTTSLSPVATPTNTATVPTKVLQMIRCGCSQTFLPPLLSVDV